MNAFPNWPPPGYVPPTPNAFALFAPWQNIPEVGPAFRSSKYPNLHPILAADSTILRFDIKMKPQSEILAPIWFSTHNAPVMAPSVSHMRIISKQFPWTIDLFAPVITCEVVWEGIYVAMQQHMADSEWGAAIGDKKLKETIEKAAKHRSEIDSDKRFKRIDWLGDNTYFRGLEKDDDFARARLLPETNDCKDTWILKMGH